MKKSQKELWLKVLNIFLISFIIFVPISIWINQVWGADLINPLTWGKISLGFELFSGLFFFSFTSFLAIKYISFKSKISHHEHFEFYQSDVGHLWKDHFKNDQSRGFFNQKEQQSLNKSRQEVSAKTKNKITTAEELPEEKILDSEYKKQDNKTPNKPVYKTENINPDNAKTKSEKIEKTENENDKDFIKPQTSQVNIKSETSIKEVQKTTPKNNEIEDAKHKSYSTSEDLFKNFNYRIFPTAKVKKFEPNIIAIDSDSIIIAKVLEHHDIIINEKPNEFSDDKSPYWFSSNSREISYIHQLKEIENALKGEIEDLLPNYEIPIKKYIIFENSLIENYDKVKDLVRNSDVQFCRLNDDGEDRHLPLLQNTLKYNSESIMIEFEEFVSSLTKFFASKS